MTMVTSPACGIPAAPMLAAVAVMLQREKEVTLPRPWLQGREQDARASGPAKGRHPHLWKKWRKLENCLCGTETLRDSGGLPAQLAQPHCGPVLVCWHRPTGRLPQTLPPLQQSVLDTSLLGPQALPSPLLILIPETRPALAPAPLPALGMYPCSG